MFIERGPPQSCMFTSAKPNKNSAFDQTHLLFLGFPGGSDNNLPTMQATQVESLGWEDPLQKGMATHFSNSFLENSMDRGPWWGYSPWSHKESESTEH